jgi:hypothetical protein
MVVWPFSEELKVTLPVGAVAPLTPGVTVAVKVTASFAEEEGIADTTAVLVDVCDTDCVTTFEVAPLKFLSLLANVAVTVCAPAEPNGTVQVLEEPDVTVTWQRV